MPSSPRDYVQLRSDLADRFGGITAYTRAPARGVWKGDTGATTRDDIVILEVMTDELDRAWWSGFRRELERRFRQESVIVRALTGTFFVRSNVGSRLSRPSSGHIRKDTCCLLECRRCPSGSPSRWRITPRPNSARAYSVPCPTARIQLECFVEVLDRKVEKPLLLFARDLDCGTRWHIPGLPR